MNSRSFISTSAPLLKRICERQAPTTLSRSEDSFIDGETASPHAAAISTIERVVNSHEIELFTGQPFTGLRQSFETTFRTAKRMFFTERLGVGTTQAHTYCQRQKHPDAYGRKHISRPVNPEHQTRNADRKNPNERNQHSEFARSMPDSVHADNRRGSKCCNNQRMPAGKTGTPIPLGLPKIRTSAAD